ncbi:hypothetical protein INT44_002974 [Umbelopsis vinacea]|uniref:Uncharacterized protein n=1 Tax=Umbelopsis vinacea TaxID=44442 RepID=A0A8H7Q7P0_9FUNG|nr:hypothetical protein INT44_002974 [Umbelopsis vinacea]
MVSITVGQITGAINACVIIARWTTELACVVVLVYFMGNSESSTTWSRFTASIQKSVWPILLRTQSINRKDSVHQNMETLATAALLGGIILAIAHVTIPLGLYTTSNSRPTTASVNTYYVADTGPFGIGTADRSYYTETRTCDMTSIMPCPGQSWLNGVPTNVNASGPQDIIDVFSKAKVSSISMQYRNYVLASNKLVNNNQPYTQGTWNTLKSIVATDTFAPVEGAIYNVQYPPFGLGLINHTLPDEDAQSYWTRDMLWLQPLVECQDTGLTLDHAVADDANNFTTPVYITDRGGFSNLSDTAPNWNQSIDDNHNFGRLDLELRASIGVYYHNELLMNTLHLSKQNISAVGSSYLLSNSSTLLASNNGGQLSSIFGIQPLAYLSSLPADGVYDHEIKDYCAGYLASYPSSSQYKLVRCMLAIGTPTTLSTGVSAFWSHPLQVCAATTVASVNTVHYRRDSNANTSDLSQVEIVGYANKDVLWGVELTGSNISFAHPYWGPLADDYIDTPPLDVTYGVFFTLPAWYDNTGSLGLGSFSDAQGTAIPGKAWSVLAGEQAQSYSSLFQNNGDRAATYAHWQSAGNYGNLISQIWTDLMVNNVVGTSTNATASVSAYPEQLAYSYVFAIPGLLLLAIWIPIVATAFGALITRRVTKSIAIQALNQTSIGRVVMSMTGETSGDWQDTNEWAEQEGRHKIGIGKQTFTRDPQNVKLATALLPSEDNESHVHNEESIELEEYITTKS